jgi:hypothetical protein
VQKHLPDKPGPEATITPEWLHSLLRKALKKGKAPLPGPADPAIAGLAWHVNLLRRTVQNWHSPEREQCKKIDGAIDTLADITPAQLVCRL